MYKSCDVACKLLSHAIDSHVLMEENPCINKGVHALLMHSFSYACNQASHKHMLNCEYLM